MPERSMKVDDPLEDFARREITLDGVTKRVYVSGAGPAVILMTEMPGKVTSAFMIFDANASAVQVMRHVLRHHA